MNLRTILFAIAAYAVAVPALAASSAWHDAQGGRVRLVTTGQPDSHGRLYGALQIDLKPGWKTYWRDPGGSGVPPSIDVSGNPLLAGAVIDFPPPQHHFDGQSTWAGYDAPVVLPVTFTMRASGQPGLIEAAVFLGICETICVPVQAVLSVDPANDTDNPADAALVAAARAALPAPASEAFSVRVQQADEKSVTFDIEAPAGSAEVDLFLAGADGYMFGPPKLVPGEKGITYVASIVTRPAAKPAGEGLHYTLVTPSGAVAGVLPYF